MNEECTKEMLKDWMKLQLGRLETNQCSAEEINKLADVINRDLDTSISRKEAIRHFGVSQNVFDTRVHRRLSPKAIKRNIVSYSFKALSKIFT